MYFFRLKRLFFTLGAFGGLLLAILMEDSVLQRRLTWFALGCLTALMTEQMLTLRHALRLGGWPEGLYVYTRVQLMTGLTYQEFLEVSDRVMAQVREEMRLEATQVEAAQKAAVADRQRQAFLAEIGRQRAFRYARKLERLGADQPTATLVARTLAQTPPHQAQRFLDQTRQRMALLREAELLGEEHVSVLAGLFTRNLPPQDELTEGRAYLVGVRNHRELLAEASALGVQAEVRSHLEQGQREQAMLLLGCAREEARRRTITERLASLVASRPPHLRPPLEDLLTAVRNAPTQRDWRKAVHALERRLGV